MPLTLKYTRTRRLLGFVCILQLNINFKHNDFKFNNIVYLRDYEDFIWSIEDGSPRDIVGRFDNEKEMIVEVDYKIEIED